VFFKHAGGTPNRWIQVYNSTVTTAILAGESGPTPSVNPNRTQITIGDLLALTISNVLQLRAYSDTAADVVYQNDDVVGAIATTFYIVRIA
jgi:hypothetical protein